MMLFHGPCLLLCGLYYTGLLYCMIDIYIVGFCIIIYNSMIFSPISFYPSKRLKGFSAVFNLFVFKFSAHFLHWFVR